MISIPMWIINSLQEIIGACQIFAEWINEMNVATNGLRCFPKPAGWTEVIDLLSLYKLNNSGYLCTFTCYVGEVVTFYLDAWNLPLLVRSSEPARINAQKACSPV